MKYQMWNNENDLDWLYLLADPLELVSIWTNAVFTDNNLCKSIHHLNRDLASTFKLASGYLIGNIII